MMSRALAASVLLAAFATRGESQGESRAALLLTLPSSARGLALGEAWGAVANDESAVFYNPAQLARMRGAAAGGSVERYVVSTTLAALAAAVPLARGTVAIGAQVLDYGSEPEFVAVEGAAGAGSPTGASVSAQDIAVTAGYGTRIGSAQRLRLGVAIKVARQHVANVSGSAIAGDLGAAYTSARGWEFAAALQHLGSRLRLASVSAPLPWTWRLAAAAPVAGGERFALRTMAEARRSSGGPATGVLAAEATWRALHTATTLSARAGYAMHGAGEDRSPLTMGGGITLGRFAVDYAYEGFDLLGGATHRVGVRYARGTGGG